MRSGCASGSIFWLPLLWGRFWCFKTIIPEHRSTFLPSQHAPPLISSVDWGLHPVQTGSVTIVTHLEDPADAILMHGVPGDAGRRAWQYHEQ